MKLTKSNLKQIIKEEIAQVITEAGRCGGRAANKETYALISARALRKQGSALSKFHAAKYLIDNYELVLKCNCKGRPKRPPKSQAAALARRMAAAPDCHGEVGDDRANAIPALEAVVDDMIIATRTPYGANKEFYLHAAVQLFYLYNAAGWKKKAAWVKSLTCKAARAWRLKEDHEYYPGWACQ